MCDAGLFKIACKRSARAAILKPPPDKYRSAMGGEAKKTPILSIDHSFPTENTQGAYAIRPYSLPAAGFRIPPHDIARNPAGFGFCHTTWCKTRRVLDSATRHSVKPGGFWTLPHDIARNPAGFIFPHTTWRETRRVLDFATRHSTKPGGFWTLSHDIARNPAGF